jgi:hypothetical protein
MRSLKNTLINDYVIHSEILSSNVLFALNWLRKFIFLFSLIVIFILVEKFDQNKSQSLSWVAAPLFFKIDRLNDPPFLGLFLPSRWVNKDSKLFYRRLTQKFLLFFFSVFFLDSILYLEFNDYILWNFFFNRTLN